LKCCPLHVDELGFWLRRCADAVHAPPIETDCNAARRCAPLPWEPRPKVMPSPAVRKDLFAEQACWTSRPPIRSCYAWSRPISAGVRHKGPILINPSSFPCPDPSPELMLQTLGCHDNLNPPITPNPMNFLPLASILPSLDSVATFAGDARGPKAIQVNGRGDSSLGAKPMADAIVNHPAEAGEWQILSVCGDAPDRALHSRSANKPEASRSRHGTDRTKAKTFPQSTNSR